MSGYVLRNRIADVEAMLGYPLSGPQRTWVRSQSDFEQWDYEGVQWSDAPVPRRFHRHRAQTYAWHNFDYVERCACGGIRMQTFGGWLESNSRKR